MMRAAYNFRRSNADPIRLLTYGTVLLFAAGCHSEPTKHETGSAAARQTNEVEKSHNPQMPRKTNRLSNFSGILDPQRPIQCRSAVEWIDLFRRYEDWSGTDGVYSMPLSGVQAPGHASNSLTLFTFGDTILGKVDRETLERQKPRMVNLSEAMLRSE